MLPTANVFNHLSDQVPCHPEPGSQGCVFSEIPTTQEPGRVMDSNQQESATQGDSSSSSSTSNTLIQCVNSNSLFHALDLFSGKGSVTQALQKNNFHVISVDINAKFNPTHSVDILSWDFRQYPPGYFKVIAAHVPCNEYSRAKTVGSRNFEESDKLVKRTLEIVEYFQPELWWLENPRTGFLSRRACVQHLPYIDFDYCQFSDWGYQKPTRFWGSDNLTRLTSKVCDGKNCPNLLPGKKRHRQQLGGLGMKFGTYQKWRVPEQLINYLLSALDLHEEKFSFKREDYAVRNEFVQAIETEFQCKADCDCFANIKNARCTSFYSKENDAFQREWGPNETLWLNPPWRLWPKVAKKLRKSNCDAICVLPDWQRGWVTELLRNAARKMYFPAGTKLFEVNGKPVGGTHWGVWALLIKGNPHKDTNTQTRVVTLKNRMFKQNFHPPNLRKFCKDRQLLVRTKVELLNGTTQKLDILIDTGAEANLIKSGLIPEHLMYPAKEPLRFQTANGEILEGGSRCTRVKMKLQLEKNEKAQPEEISFDTEFYDANIQVDAILSFPWLAQNRLGIFPHHRALVMDSPDLQFLYGLRDHRRKKSKKGKKEYVVSTVGQMMGELEKYDLHLPVQDFDQKKKFLGQDDLRVLAAELEKDNPHVHIQTMIAAREGGGESNVDDRVEKLKEAIHAEFDGTVFRNSVFPDPPVRGDYGYAVIPLKEGAVPTRQKPFFMHGERREALEKITQEWIDMKFIEPATSKNTEWLSQTFPVPKKSGDFPWRGVVDMRGPNSQTRRCNYPLPKIEDILVKHGSNQMFSILDLKQAFHQQPLHPDSRPITTSFTSKGLYQWRVNVMGLMNASQQFQQMLDDRLRPVRDIATPYVDDILVGTTVGEGEDLLEAHARDLRRVLKVLAEERLVVDPKKAKLFVTEVEFCGQILGGGTRRPAPGKLQAIEKWEVPTTISALRAFLGFTNYYNTYIHMYAQIAARLQDKLKVPREVGKKGSKVKITFDKEDLAAFEELKKRLCSGLILHRVDPDKPFVLRVDASGYAVGATLEQLKEGGGRPTAEDVIQKKTVPVAFMSRKLTEGQRKWTPRELETYAIILALQKWESWVGLQPVLVLTDHQSLEAWAKETLDTPSGPVGRRARWHQIFSKYDLTVGYIPGKENTIADILSRWAYPASQALRDISRHGSIKDKEEMEEIMKEEREGELSCMMIKLKNQPCMANQWIRGVVTRSGKKVEEKGNDASEKGSDGGNFLGGTKTPEAISSQGPRSKGKKSVRFWDEIDAAGNAQVLPTPSPIESLQDSQNTMMGGGQLSSCVALGDGKSVWEVDWGTEYVKCPIWRDVWNKMHSGGEWPHGFKFFQGHLFLQEKLCVPLGFQDHVLQENHDFLGHVGAQKVWSHSNLRYRWADEKRAQRSNEEISKQCGTCQACVRGNTLKGPIESTPIPPAPMTSVAIDLFKMPHVWYEGGGYDTMAVCVDRHSGWIVAVPCLEKGLTGAKLAKAMVKHQWRPFGIPSVISSDQGSHFVSAWWQNLCYLLGIRLAFSQAYHHQANGRVERAGQQIMEVLRKLQADSKINWVEALPQVLDRIHDVKGESGYSPYEILFGRQRPLAGVPYTPPKECEDAQEFFSRMKKIDEKVAQILNHVHEMEAKRVNLNRKEMEPFAIGDLVWYKRPENSGEKLDSRWIGPGTITAREGDHSYLMEIKPGLIMKTHRSFLKPYREPKVEGKGIPLHFFRRTEKTEDALPDEWEVEKILAHRKKNGRWEFLTKWAGCEEGEETWEPVKNFIHRYSGEFFKYWNEKRVPIDLRQELHVH